MAEEESITEGEETGLPYQPVGRDLLEKYMIELDYKPVNPLDRYGSLIKLVTIGMELLPYYDDPTEIDPDRIQANKEKQEKVDELYAKAAGVLKTEIPAKRTVNYGYVDHGGERSKVYIIQSSESKDAGKYQILEKDYKEGMDNFITQQHEQHISELQGVHTEILHELTQSGIVPSINPTLDQMIKEEIKSLHREITDMMIAKEEEEVTKEKDKDGERKRKI